jgi:hypothetical protein
MEEESVNLQSHWPRMELSQHLTCPVVPGTGGSACGGKLGNRVKSHYQGGCWGKGEWRQAEEGPLGLYPDLAPNCVSCWACPVSVVPHSTHHTPTLLSQVSGPLSGLQVKNFGPP